MIKDRFITIQPILLVVLSIIFGLHYIRTSPSWGRIAVSVCLEGVALKY